MKALILAGGRGVRLGKITQKNPKPMLKIGGFPILEHQINLLKKYGVTEVLILTCHLSEVIENYFKDGRSWGMKISYFKEKEPLGTAGGIKALANKLKEDFLVLYGDKMLDMDIDQLINFHKNKKSACTIVLHPTSHLADSDLVEINEDQRIIAFHPKPHSSEQYFRNLVNAAVYVLSPRVLKYIPKGEKTDFGKDIFPKIVKKEKIYGYLTAEYIKDVGTPERMVETKRDWQSGKIKRLNRNNRRKAIFLDRDGTINRTLGDVCRRNDFHLFPQSAAAIKKINDSEFLAIVITNQPAVAKGFCSIEELEIIHKKMEANLGKEGAKLDGIYFCPHHPDRGFPGENLKYKIECSCRKPKIGLVKKAEKDFNINLKKSYFVGDSFRDILCGRTAGMTTVGIKTGRGCQDDNIKPDYLKKDILEAVNFILKK